MEYRIEYKRLEKAEVFISYHLKTSGEIVYKIASALEKENITCWYAPRNSGDYYVASIMKAIKGCKVFLLVLDEKSNISAHVLNEVHYAFDRLKEGDGIFLIPFRVDACSLSQDMNYYLGRIHIMDGTLPPKEMRIQELVGRISDVLARKSVRSGEANAAFLQNTIIEKNIYRLIDSRVYPDKNFIGREKELKKISECLNSVENKVFLVGMGGMGKSEIARVYLKRHAQNYDVILWITFTGTIVETISNDSTFTIQGINRVNYPEDNDETYFKRKLRVLKEISDQKVLIVIDNFDVLDDKYLEEFCSGTYSVIFTTRYHQKSGRVLEIEVNEISSKEELMNLFRTQYRKAISGEEKEYIEEILDCLYGHPLCIRLVASVMQSQRLSPQKMLSMLKKGTFGIKRGNLHAAKMIFGCLQQVFQLSILTEEEKYLLKNLSLVPLSGISVERFYDWCEMKDYDIIDELINKNWVIHNPITDEIHLHPLIADLILEELMEDPQCCLKYLEHLEYICANTFNIKWEEKQKLFEYTRVACEKVPEYKPLQKLVWMARAGILSDISLYEESCKLYQKAFVCAERLEDKIRLYHYISHMQIMGGNFEEGIETAQSGLEELKNISLDQMSRELGYYRNELLRRLSEGNRGMGNYNLAIKYAREAVNTCEGFYIDSPEGNRGWAEYHLARSLFESGELDESEKLIWDVLSLFSEIKDEWSSGHSYELLGQILMKKKQFNEALKWNQKAYNIMKNLHGLDYVQQYLVYRANIYREMGNEKAALQYYRQAAERYRKYGCFKLEEMVLAIMRGEAETLY